LVTKRYVGFVLAALFALGAAGCANTANSDQSDPAVLAAAIDAYLADHPERICTAPLFLPYDERVDGEDPALRAARHDELRWLDGLAEAGLLLKARTTARGTAASGPTPVDEYALSAAGRRELDNARLVDLGAPARFCVAATRVGTVLRVIPRSERGGTVRTVVVRYRPALAERAAWARRARARAAMPWLPAWTNDQLGERRVTLRMVAGGWIVL
jgi:hypothetical protein